MTDHATGLKWQDDYSDNGGTVKTTNRAGATSYCAALTLDGSGWRLPTMNELMLLVDRSRDTPAIDPIFQMTAINVYWSETDMWGVSFRYGTGGDFPDNGFTAVRCARN